MVIAPAAAVSPAAERASLTGRRITAFLLIALNQSPEFKADEEENYYYKYKYKRYHHIYSIFTIKDKKVNYNNIINYMGEMIFFLMWRLCRTGVGGEAIL